MKRSKYRRKKNSGKTKIEQSVFSRSSLALLGIAFALLSFASITKSIPINIEITSKAAAASITIDLPSEQRSVHEGDSLKAQITLFPVGDRRNIEIEARYFIKAAEGVLITEEHENLFVDSQLSYVKEFNTKNLIPGNYMIGIEAVSKDGVIVTSTPFTVTRSLDAAPAPIVTASMPFNAAMVIGAIMALILTGLIAKEIIARFKKNRY